jgi:hypothetical protein
VFLLIEDTFCLKMLLCDNLCNVPGDTAFRLRCSTQDHGKQSNVTISVVCQELRSLGIICSLTHDVHYRGYDYVKTTLEFRQSLSSPALRLPGASTECIGILRLSGREIPSSSVSKRWPTFLYTLVYDACATCGKLTSVTPWKCDTNPVPLAPVG